MGAPSNRTATPESQMIPMIQDVLGRTLRLATATFALQFDAFEVRLKDRRTQTNAKPSKPVSPATAFAKQVIGAMKNRLPQIGQVISARCPIMRDHLGHLRQRIAHSRVSPRGIARAAARLAWEIGQQRFEGTVGPRWATCAIAMADMQEAAS